MLHIIKNNNDKYFTYLKDDPVRPNIPFLNRIGENKEIFVLERDSKVAAITCVSYQTEVPLDEPDLFQVNNIPDIAIFYTIWSYAPKAGRELIFSSVEEIKKTKTNINRFVTLSPKTEMAAKFHLGNGAFIYRENKQTINYEYKF